MGFVTISNSLTDVCWESPENCHFVISDQADVWQFSISRSLPSADNYLAMLNPAEIERAGRYRQTKDKNRFIVSRGALRTVLGKYLDVAPADVKLGVGPFQKPSIANSSNKNLHFNLSHSGDCILLAISGSEIGVDVEIINTLFKYREILADNFSTDEIRFIDEGPAAERFFLLWTRKEAILKGIGTGLDGDLRLIPSLGGDHNFNYKDELTVQSWRTSSLTLNPGHIVSVSVQANIYKINYWAGDLLSLNSTNN